MIFIIVLNNRNQIMLARSRKFADVPKTKFAKGAILTNYGRHYKNIGDEFYAMWHPLKGYEIESNRKRNPKKHSRISKVKRNLRLAK